MENKNHTVRTRHGKTMYIIFQLLYSAIVVLYNNCDIKYTQTSLVVFVTLIIVLNIYCTCPAVVQSSATVS